MPGRPKRLLLHACCGPVPHRAARGARGARPITSPSSSPTPTSTRPRSTSVAATRCARTPSRSASRSSSSRTIPPSGQRPSARSQSAGPSAAAPATRCGWVTRRATRRENGFDALATTLTVSPYQDADAIAEEGEARRGSGGDRLPRPRLSRPLPRGDASLARSGHVPPELLRVRAVRGRGAGASVRRARRREAAEKAPAASRGRASRKNR